MPTGQELLDVIQAKQDEFKQKPIRTFFTNIFSGFGVNKIEPIKAYLSEHKEIDFEEDSKALYDIIILFTHGDPSPNIFDYDFSSETAAPLSLNHDFSYDYKNKNYALFQFFDILLKKLFHCSESSEAENTTLASPVRYPELDAIHYLVSKNCFTQENLALLQKMQNPRDTAIALNIITTNGILSRTVPIETQLPKTLISANMARIIYYLSKAKILDEGKIVTLSSLSDNSLQIKHLARIIESLHSAKRLSSELFDFLVKQQNSLFLESTELYEILTLFSDNYIDLSLELWEGIFLHNPLENLDFQMRISHFLPLVKKYPFIYRGRSASSEDDTNEKFNVKIAFYKAILAPENNHLLITDTLLRLIQGNNPNPAYNDFRTLSITLSHIFSFMDNLWDELFCLMREQTENHELTLKNAVTLLSTLNTFCLPETKEALLRSVFSAEYAFILTSSDIDASGFKRQLAQISSTQLTLEVWNNILVCYHGNSLDPEAVLEDYLRTILGNQIRSKETKNSEHMTNIEIIKQYLRETGILTSVSKENILGQIIDPDNTVLFTTILDNGQSVARQLSLIPKHLFTQEKWDKLLDCCAQSYASPNKSFNEFFTEYMQQFMGANAHQKQRTEKRPRLDSSTEESKQGLEDTLEKHFSCLKSMIEQAVKDAKESRKSESQSAQTSTSSLNASCSMYHNRESYPKIDALYKLLHDPNNFLPVIAWLKNAENRKELRRGLFGTYFQQQFSEESTKNPFNCHNLEDLADCMERYGSSKPSAQLPIETSREEYKSHSLSK